MLMEIEQDKRLVEASRSGDIDLVKTLLKTGASPDATEYNKSLFYDSKNYLTPLMTAASQGHAEVVRWLIENGGRFLYFSCIKKFMLNYGGRSLYFNCIKKIMLNYPEIQSLHVQIVFQNDKCVIFISIHFLFCLET